MYLNMLFRLATLLGKVISTATEWSLMKRNLWDGWFKSDRMGGRDRHKGKKRGEVRGEVESEGVLMK